MSKKKSFVLRVQQEVYDALERWASDEFRSVNGQIEYILHQSLKSAGRDSAAKQERTKAKN
jgi:hypothetical protein